MKRSFWLSAVVTLACGARLAHADAGGSDPTAAIQLYDAAIKLTKTGDYAGACPKFAESERLDPQLGTLLHLADCFEKVGKTASAWARWKDAIDVATKTSDARQNIARQ